MSLISDGIQTMGAPAQAETKDPNAQTSIGLWHSIKDWWSVASVLQKPTEKVFGSPRFDAAHKQCVQIEYNLFSAILSPDVYITPVYEEENTTEMKGDQKIVATFKDTLLPEEHGTTFIHELEVTNTTDPSVPKKHIVLMHGYMAAMGYFVKNVEELAKSYPNSVLHVIDMPGFGNSARPLFPKRLLKLPAGASKVEQIQQIIAVENWFIDKLEAWRIEKKIDHFDLVAHSMGAYISSCYLLKYNKTPTGNIVDKFVLVSPLGTESSDISLLNDKKLQYNHHDVASDPLQEIFASQDFDHEAGPPEELVKLWEKLGKPKFPRNIVLRKLWENSVSPFQLLQLFGPFYSKLLSLWSFQRFQNLSANDSAEQGASDGVRNNDLILKLHDYSFCIFNQYQASGELAITKIINHEIVPRMPLCDRGFMEFLNDNKISTLWMYGDKDWMNTKGGEYCVSKLQSMDDNRAELVVVKSAGHHLYLDNPGSFNKDVIDFLGLSRK